jgi:hypothetical protein
VSMSPVAAFPATAFPRAGYAGPRPRPRASGLAVGLVGLGGVVSAVGSVLPWSELSSGGERRVFSGVTVGDGRLCLLLGAALVACALLGARSRTLGRSGGLYPTAAVLAAVVLLLTLADFAVGPAPLASFRGLSGVLIRLQPRVGILVTFLGGVVTEAGVALAVWRPDPRGRRPGSRADRPSTRTGRSGSANG